MKYSAYPNITVEKRIDTNPCDICNIRSLYKVRCDSGKWIIDSVTGRMREVFPEEVID